MLNNLSNLSTKKKLTYITIAVLLVITIAVATAFILKSSTTNNTNNSTPTKTPTTKASADALKAKAIEALKTNNTNSAKTLFQDAKQQYQDLGDTNNIKDVEAQLFLIEHPSALK